MNTTFIPLATFRTAVGRLVLLKTYISSGGVYGNGRWVAMRQDVAIAWALERARPGSLRFFYEQDRHWRRRAAVEVAP